MASLRIENVVYCYASAVFFCITNKQTRYAVQYTTTLPHHMTPIRHFLLHQFTNSTQIALHLDIYWNKYSVSGIKLPDVRTALQHYSTTTLQHYNTTALQHCSTTTLQHCSTATLQHYNTTALQHYNITALQHYSTAALQHCSSTALQHYSTTTPQHYNTTALQHYSTAALQHCRYSRQSYSKAHNNQTLLRQTLNTTQTVLNTRSVQYTNSGEGIDRICTSVYVWTGRNLEIFMSNWLLCAA